MSQPYKICPRCQQPADLAAPSCVKCGRIYKTQFTPPEEKTQAFPGGIPAAAPPPQAAPGVEFRVTLGKPVISRKLIPWAVGGLVALVLLLTNPGKAEFVSWLKEQALARMEKPRDDKGGVGQSLAVAIAGPYIDGHTTVLNFGFFSVARFQDGTMDKPTQFLGVAKFFIPLQPMDPPAKTQAPAPAPTASGPATPAGPGSATGSAQPAPTDTTPSYSGAGDPNSIPSAGGGSTAGPALHPAPARSAPFEPPVPNVLPCGDRLVRFERASGGMMINGQEIRLLGVCSSGHRYGLVGKAWFKPAGY